jgi:hypothetical protein
MASMRVDYTTMEWSSAVPFYGPAAVYDNKDIVQLKVLSDRRPEGGGIAWLVRMMPPTGKLIKIVAVALSDEHIFSLQGGRSKRAVMGSIPRAAAQRRSPATGACDRGEPDDPLLEVVDKPRV